MQSHLFVRRVVFCCVLMSACTILGCAGDLQQLQQAQTQASATLAAAQAAAATVQQTLTTQPSDASAKQELQQIQTIISQVQSELPAVSAAIQSASSGAVDPAIQQAAAAIPYGSLALAAISLIVAVVKHIQAGNLTQQVQAAQKAFQQIVTAMDAVVPNPTAEQQSKVDAVLDSDVKAKVAAARA